MRSLRFMTPRFSAVRFNPVLVFHVLVLVLVLASMAAAGGKQVCSTGLDGLETLRCGLESWGAEVLDGGLVPGLAGLSQVR